MSLKELFGKTSTKIVSNKALQDLYNEAESEGYLEELLEDKERFLPDVDFTTASNFARYGSAEKYYVDSMVGIYQNYPYDGSKKEKQQWRNNSSQLDLYIFDNIYPKSTGYVNLDSGSTLPFNDSSIVYRASTFPQFITVKGGPNASITGEFNTSNIYDISKNRESNLGITEFGNTVEFWVKDNISTASVTSNYVFSLFDVWNGNSSGSNNYSRLLIEHSSSNTFLITYASGTNGVTRHPITYNQDRNNWHHYAFTLSNNLDNFNDLDICLYIDGNLVSSETVVNAGGFSLADNFGMIANIGAYRADITGQNENLWNGLGTSFCSFDEIRFWKTARNSKQIYRNWFTNIGGGTNTDDSNTDLGLYFKLNEGIVNTEEINNLDSLVIDYSGRVSNGLIENYNLNCRNTSSAIDEYFNDSIEAKDPILFSSNPLIQEVIKDYRELGAEYDRGNNANIYYSIPSWITEEAEKNESNDLSNLVQIISSYFDTLHLQIKDLPTLRNTQYIQEGTKPKPFSDKLLSSYGFENIDLFNDTSFLEDVLSRNENTEFDDKLHNIKNTIYQNIFNNLSYIYKSKGTEKSLRNLIRCFGVDDELIKINLYADNSQYELTTKYKSVSSPKKFIDFNNADRYNGFIYQKNITGDADTRSYILGSNSGEFDYIPLTAQIETIFPKKVSYDNPQYDVPDFTEVSIFGAHTAKTDEENLVWGNNSGNDLFNFQVYAVKRNYESSDVYFKLVTTIAGVTSSLTTSYFNDVYDNQKWNFAVRISSKKYDFANTASGSTTGDYTLEFIGNNSILDNLENSFKLTLSIPEANAKQALNANKRFYVGAHYTNFDPSYLLTRTDIKASSLRVWLDYLADEELLHHSYDSTNIGRQYPNWKPSYQIGSSEVFTKLDTLALDWDFFNITTTDNNGEFLVQDTSSGSMEQALDSVYPPLGSVTKIRHTGYAKEFYPNDDQVVNKEYIFNAKQVFPESIAGSDLIQTPITDDVTRTKTSKPINFYLSIEKSMSQVINEEILNWFATIKDFNNLIGDPVEKYRAEYKSLAHLRRLFFEKVQNTPDFEKFLEFYKWIDNSISSMISQLIPASANVSNKVRNMVESHLLERNKYQNIAPAVNFNGDIVSTIGSGLDFSYEEQKAPASPAGTLWLKQRAERTNTLVNTPLEPQNDIDREIIRQVINNKNLNKLPVLYSVDANVNYEGNKDKIHFFSKVYRLNTEKLTIVEDTVNPLTVGNAQITSQFKFASDTVTGSGQIVQPITKKPNFFNKYEYLQLSSRAANNKSFVDLTGNLGDTTSSLSGVVDRTLPARSAYKNIFAERFSAPGGPEVLSRGALDNASEEYSAYNDLNSRNIRVRKQLRNWLGESSSYDSTNPSIHKVNKNAGYRPIDNTGLNTKAVYDNDFVSHQIPQSDAQYAWITGSLAVKPNTSGYMTDYDNLNSYNSSSFQLLSGTVSGTQIVDYVGLNITTDRTFNTSSGITSTGSNYNGDLNKYLNNNNGPYGYPSWKQIRKDNNKIVQDSVKNNKILSQDIPTQKSKAENGYTTYYTEEKAQTFTGYKQPAVTFNKPMKHSLFVTGSEAPIETVSTYDNNKERFTNTDLMRATNTFDKTDAQAHDLFAALDDGLYDPKPELYKIEYDTMLYPSDTYAGLSDVRMRDNYEDFVDNTGSIVNARTFWRDSVAERARANVTQDVYEFGDTSYNVLPNKKYLTIYNDQINNIVAFKGQENCKESIFSQENIYSFSYSTASSNIFNGSLYLNYVAIYNEKNNEYIPLIKGTILNVTSLHSGNNGVFIGGLFNNSSFVDLEYSRSYIANWNGFTWSNMSGGLNNAVEAVFSGSDGVYVGGFFTSTLNSPVVSISRIAKWNGTSWSSLSNGLNFRVRSISSGSDGVYVGGEFSTASNGGSSVSVNYIAKWNGTLWSNMLGGLNNASYCVISGSDGVYVGGYFTIAYNGVGSTSPVTVNYIAKWNGTSWSSLSNGLDGVVRSISSGSDGLYVGGDFATAYNGATPVTVNRIAKWNGTSWSSLSSGISSTVGQTVYSIFSNSSGVYVGGEFATTYNGIVANNIAKWNGVSWTALSNGFNIRVTTLHGNNTNIYIGGNFTSLTNYVKEKIINYNYFYKGDINKTNFIENNYYLTNNILYPLKNICSYDVKNNNIYGLKNNYSYINQFNGDINTIVSSSEGVYIGGRFNRIDGILNVGISKWNGASWTSLSNGLDVDSVDSIYSGSDGVYVGGSFITAYNGATPVPVNRIAKWNGTSWSSLSSGFNGRVRSIYSGSDGVYAGGDFTQLGSGISMPFIAKWNGLSWSSLSNGVNDLVHSIYSGSDGVYVGGSFITAYNGATPVPVNRIAKWNGTSWSSLKDQNLFYNGVSGLVRSIYSGSDGVYVGGDFSYLILPFDGGSKIVKWDGTSWNSLGLGLNSTVYSIFSNSSGVYVGGEFLYGINTDTSRVYLNNIAKWDGSFWNQIGRSGNRNGFNVNYADTVYSITGDEQKLLIGGAITGSRSGPLIKDNNYSQFIEGYYSKNLLLPTPQLIHNNFIPPSNGSLSGMKIAETQYNSSNVLSLPITQYTSSERINILNDGYRYEIDEKSGKTPFFNSYLEYLGDLKARTAKYSIIPEYTISDYIKTYVKEKNGNFNSILNEDYLKLDGAAQENGYENINNSINTTNLLKPELIFDNSKNNDNINLNLKVSGIKKLIPYRDFYPSERIVKLSNYFINSFLDLDTRLTSVLNPDEIYSSSLSNGTPINQQILTLLQPMMAPGILLNTIKSSVAVDWPAFICNSGSYDSTASLGFYANTGSNLITNQAYNPVTNQYYNYTASNYINQESNFRFPFESIIEFDTQIPQALKTDDKNLYYLNPTYYTSDAITGSDYGLFAYPSYNMGNGSLKPFIFRDNNYKLAIHNFLAEIPNFFLNGKLSNIVSLPESEFEVAKAGVRYYMDVVLERDSKYKEFIADPYYEGLKAQDNSFSDGTFLLPSPDSLYGPPTRYWHNANANPFFARSPYNFYSKLLDTPAYAPYVPPYYYGKAIARISFLAEDNRQYSLSEIQKLCTIEYINSEAEALFAKRSSFINGNFSAPYTDNYTSSPAYKQMMTLSSSINLFLAADTKLTKFDPKTGQTIEISDRESNNKSWIIQTKFETPSINFIDADLSENIGLKFLGGTKESGSVNGIYSYMMKGLWTTYGQPVQNGSGIKLYIEPSHEKITDLTGSLIDLCGFRNVLDQKKTIGLLAERKKVSECMVMIPYTFISNDGTNSNEQYAVTLPEILGENGIYASSQTGNGPYYYAIDTRVITEYLGGLDYRKASIDQIKAAAEASIYQESTIIKLILAMIKYVVPPHLDWLRNKDIRPFVMYVAEFSTEFDKQDLSDIWQGVMPKQSYTAELEDISINHKFTANEFFHGKRPQNDTKFKVFKVKQRANINYYKLTDDSKDDDRFKFTFGNSQQATIPEYSYNWPYDFFSLVELVNIDASLSVDNYPETTEALKKKEKLGVLSDTLRTAGPLKPDLIKDLTGNSTRDIKKGKTEIINTRFRPGADVKLEQPETPLLPKPKRTKKPRGD